MQNRSVVLRRVPPSLLGVVSTLALGSFVTFAAIIVGGFYGLKLLERWVLAAE